MKPRARSTGRVAPALAEPVACDSLRPSHAIGVGSNGEDPVTEVRGADGCSW
jgi:hypothetical protein